MRLTFKYRYVLLGLLPLLGGCGGGTLHQSAELQAMSCSALDSADAGSVQTLATLQEWEDDPEVDQTVNRWTIQAHNAQRARIASLKSRKNCG